MAKEKQFMIATWIVYDVWVGCGNLRELGSPKTTATKKKRHEIFQSRKLLYGTPGR